MKKVQIVLGAILLVIAGCDEAQPPGAQKSGGPFPDQILSDFEVHMTRGERKSAEIAADKGVVYRKRDSMLLQGLTARLYDSEGLHSSTLWADSGLLRERQKKMLAHGNVHLESRDSLHLSSDSLFWYGELGAPSAAEIDSGAAEDRYMVAKGHVHLITRDSVHLWTDTLLWNDISRKVATDAYVTIVRSKGDIIEGHGLRSDEQLQTVTILRAVTGTVREGSR